MSSCLWDSGPHGPTHRGGSLQLVSRLEGRRALVGPGAVAYDPVSRLVVGGHRDGTVTAWHAAAGTTLEGL